MPVRNITETTEATDAVVKDRWFNVAGKFIRPSQIANFEKTSQGKIEFVLTTGETLTGTPTAVGDTSNILYQALRRVEFDGRSEDLPPLAPRETTKLYLTSAMAEGNGGDTVQSIVTEAGPDVEQVSGSISITENTEGRWIGREFTTDAAVDWPGAQYQSESVAMLICTQVVQDVNSSFYEPILNVGDGSYEGNASRRSLSWGGGGTGNVEQDVSYITRLAFFRAAGESEGKYYKYAGYSGEETGTSSFGAQGTTSAVVRTDSGTWGDRDRYNFLRLERGISESDYDDLLIAFRNQTPGPDA